MIKHFIFLFTIIHTTFSYTQNSNTLNTSNNVNNNNNNKGFNIGNIVNLSGNWFIAYRSGIRQTQADDDINHKTFLKQEENEFVLKRSYITLKKKLNTVFSIRYTMDLTIDKEGDDAGNVETRLKYLYVKAKPNINSSFFTNTWIEAGMVHRPWLSYEQQINTYRVQDNMFIERNKIFNSADFGVIIGGNIGPKMDKTFLKEVNKAMKGKWVSYAIGVYNGGGYSGSENNRNKVFAGRISVRPFANILPELQISTYGNIGKGNTKESPDFNQVLNFIAYTGKQLTITAQHHFGVGDFRSRYTDPEDPSKSLKNNGYSFFGEYKIKKTPLAFWGRYDLFEVDLSPTIRNYTKRIIGGLTYKINKNLRVILNAEHNERDGEKNDIYECNLEVSF